MFNKIVKAVVMAALAISASANARTLTAAEIGKVFETTGGRALAEKLNIKLSEGALQASQREALTTALRTNARANEVAVNILTAVQGKSVRDANIASVSVVSNSNISAISSNAAGSTLLARTAQVGQAEKVGGTCSTSLQIPRSVNDILVGVNDCGLTAAHIAVAIKDAEAALVDGKGANDAQQIAAAMKARGIQDPAAALKTLYVEKACLQGSASFIAQVRSM